MNGTEKFGERLFSFMEIYEHFLNCCAKQNMLLRLGIQSQIFD